MHEDGFYGVGVRVSLQPPHILQHIKDIRDMDGRSIQDVIKVGDCLTHVDAVKLEGCVAEMFVWCISSVCVMYFPIKDCWSTSKGMLP